MSPYQKHEELVAVCEELARLSGVKFLYRDFRVGFREGQAKADAIRAIKEAGADQAVLTASAFAREYLDAKYYNEITVSHMGLGESSETLRYCWLISFYEYGHQEYIVYVNTETGEVENSFTIDEGIG